MEKWEFYPDFCPYKNCLWLERMERGEFIVPYINIYTFFITTEDTESTEGLCPYFLYSVFSVLSVVKLSLEIGEGIWVIDYRCLQPEKET
ncbi:hypothetical protein ACSAZK_00265 [Methanosarcina sp. Mfa9]|uniref:hypothetical protein n=1 Tax=Methanosarcina sp. Mfa9 TaxID=3439063 RepID=UPI003F87B865